MIKYYCEGCRRQLPLPGNIENGDAHTVVRLKGVEMRRADPSKVVGTEEIPCGPIVAVLPASELKRLQTRASLGSRS